MFEQPLTTTIPAPRTQIQHLIAKVPALEVPLEVPTVEQIQTNDEVFQHSQSISDSDNVMGLIGMVGGMMLLHDVAVETIHDVHDLEGHMQREKKKKDEEEE